MRIEQHAPRQGNHVRPALGDNVLGLAASRDHAHRHCRHPHLFSNLLRQVNLISRAKGNVLAWVHAAGGDVNEITIHGIQFPGKGNCFLHGPAAIHPIGGGNANAQRPVAGPDGAYGGEYFKGEAHPPVQISAIAVIALIGDGREKLMQQIAVRGMHLGHGVTGPRRPLCRRHELSLNLGQPGIIEGQRYIPIHVIRHGRGRHCLPAISLIRTNCLAAAAGRAGRGLAPGMGQLHADLAGAELPAKIYHPCDRGLISIGIEAQTLRRDTGGRRYARGLGDHQTRSAGT